MQSAKMRTEKRISEKDPEKDNFYSIIETAKSLIENNNWWIVNKLDKEKEKLENPTA